MKPVSLLWMSCNKSIVGLWGGVLVLQSLLFLPVPLPAQSWNLKTAVAKHVRLTGQANVFGELYDVQGSDRRRPPSTGRIAFSPTLTFSSLFSVSADLMLSTEGSYSRQNMNILALHPAWRWGRAHFGDFSSSFSKHTFQGVNVKGFGLELYPGWLRFSAGGGKTRRAVEGTVLNQSYEQSLVTGKIGFQLKNGSFLDIIALKVDDDPYSIKKPDNSFETIIADTLENELDTLWVEPPYNPYAVTPQENFVAGLAGEMRLFDQKMVISFEGSGSAYTKNTDADPVDADSLDMPGILREPLKKIFTPRRGSNLDYAFETKARLNAGQMTVEIGTQYVGPGYVSLGLPSSVNDRRDIYLSTSFRAGIHRLQIQGNRLSDNLLGQKRETNIRDQIRFSLNTNVPHWQSSVSLQVLAMGNHARNDTLDYSYDNLVFSTQQSMVFGKGTVVRRLGCQYTYQTSGKIQVNKQSRDHYHTVNLTGNLQMRQNVGFNGSVGLSFRNSESQGSYSTTVYSGRLTHMAMKNKLSTSLNASSSMVRDTRVLRVGATSSYRITPQNQMVFNWSRNFVWGPRDFNEGRVSLTLSHQL